MYKMISDLVITMTTSTEQEALSAYNCTKAPLQTSIAILQSSCTAAF